jgi:hypothetical protein
MSETKKVQPKTKELLPPVTLMHLEGTDWTTDPALMKLRKTKGAIGKKRPSMIKIT